MSSTKSSRHRTPAWATVPPKNRSSTSAPLFPAIGGEEQVHGGIVRLGVALQIGIDHLPDLGGPIRKPPELHIVLGIQGFQLVIIRLCPVLLYPTGDRQVNTDRTRCTRQCTPHPSGSAPRPCSPLNASSAAKVAHTASIFQLGPPPRTRSELREMGSSSSSWRAGPRLGGRAALAGTTNWLAQGYQASTLHRAMV